MKFIPTTIIELLDERIAFIRTMPNYGLIVSKLEECKDCYEKAKGDRLSDYYKRFLVIANALIADILHSMKLQENETMRIHGILFTTEKEIDATEKESYSKQIRIALADIYGEINFSKEN
jgi:hypothetical protein